MRFAARGRTLLVDGEVLEVVGGGVGGKAVVAAAHALLRVGTTIGQVTSDALSARPLGELLPGENSGRSHRVALGSVIATSNGDSHV